MKNFKMFKDVTSIGFACLVAWWVIFVVGCARFGTKQKDITYDPATGNKTREITTDAASTTFAASKSALAKWKAKQSDKDQGAEVGGLSQQADASALVEAAARGTAQGITGKK